MIWFLRILFLVVLASMLAVTSWASLRCPLFDIPGDVFSHPWFIATLADAYWGFITFFVWAAWKEQRAAAGTLWLIAVLTLGNIAMAAYFLRELFSVHSTDAPALIFTRRNQGRIALPTALVAAAVAVCFIA